jgi:enamine deaminase RidA (YjgF/YER057c/UK114 family)
VQIGDTVFVSGVLGLKKDTLKLVEGGAGPEADQALLNLGHILDAADSYYANGQLPLGNPLPSCILNIFLHQKYFTEFNFC